MTRSAWPRPAFLAPLMLASLLAGCASPPDHFHTLRPAPAVGPGAARPTPRLLAIGPVTIPDALMREQWVIRSGATGARVYDHQRWTQGLGAEVAQALVDDLNAGTLGDASGPALWADAGPSGSGSGADLERPPALRVRLQVLRLDSVLVPEPAISDQLRWSIECLPADTALGPVEGARYRLVRSAVREVNSLAPPADLGTDEDQRRFDQLARAHARTLRLVADDVAAALRDTAAERAQGCAAAAR